ncbi:Hypothetical protein R9X50_00710200 [Acrodontium crateriforme]|uniref:Zn(2)-C6 fungal-type domain-containing protein n=1 Tax=Acrodontium crateriforme TaxID=150365 RepID=A0AAQ3RDZ3_9PEZI|nr:Hypothetical protein R9X50_00710200 [Acrodontium crateriforme]
MNSSSAAPARGPNITCWECRRRRWVCDSAEPSCAACKKAGIKCPGYGEAKPVTFLPPGQVLSRPRRRPKRNNNPVYRIVSREQNTTKSQDPTSHDIEALQTSSMKTLVRKPLRGEIDDIAESLYIRNITIVPYLFTGETQPSPFIQEFVLSNLSEASRFINVALVLGALDVKSRANYRVKSTELWRFHYYKDLAIKALNRNLSDVQTRTSDVTFQNIFCFLVLELYVTTTPVWEPHVNAIVTLIKMRGGLGHFIRSSPDIAADIYELLVQFLVSNTSTPPCRQIPLFSDPETIEFMDQSKRFGTVPYFPCPHPLIMLILEVTNLRQRIYEDKRIIAEDISPSTNINAARELILRIKNFSPSNWLSDRTHYLAEWGVLTFVYHSAVCLFALAALGPNLFGPENEFRAMQSRILFSMLDKALKFPTLKFCLLWPTLVAGFEAAGGTQEQRVFVDKALNGMTTELGSASPLVAKDILQNFWRSGKRRWDDCFDRPYMFAV